VSLALSIYIILTICNFTAVSGGIFSTLISLAEVRTDKIVSTLIVWDKVIMYPDPPTLWHSSPSSGCFSGLNHFYLRKVGYNFDEASMKLRIFRLFGKCGEGHGSNYGEIFQAIYVSNSFNHMFRKDTTRMKIAMSGFFLL